MIHLMMLVLRLCLLWPQTPIVDVWRVVERSVASETRTVPAEVLLAIAHHESDLKSNAVSYVVAGHRVDRLWQHGSLPRRCTFGYLQAMCSPASSVDMQTDGGMRAGVLELEEWSRACRAGLRCMLGGHAAGNAGARNPSVTSFPALFLDDARRLGWKGSL
jgi:hypothetical protein